MSQIMCLGVNGKWQRGGFSTFITTLILLANELKHVSILTVGGIETVLIFSCSHLFALEKAILPTANATTCLDYFCFIFFIILSPTLVWLFLSSCPNLTVGCGGGRRGELHHAVLHPDGWRGLPHPDRDFGHLLPCGPITQRLDHQAPQISHFRPRHLPRHGVSHQSLLPGRHTGRTQGNTQEVCVFVCLCVRFCLPVLAKGYVAEMKCVCRR